MLLLLPLRALVDGDQEIAGGKAIGLTRLLSRGLPVPNGVVLPVEHYRRQVARPELAGLVSRVLAVDAVERASALAALRRCLVHLPLPADLEAAVRAALPTLGAGPWAVRSSATAEDQAGHSFAGQHDTRLGVGDADAVLRAIRECWASLWSERAFAYRQHAHQDHRAAAMAVVVQQLVPAETAGVCFTADPLTGARDRVVLEASLGLGEAVAAGRVAPDRFVLSRPQLRVLQQHAGNKAMSLVPDGQGGLQERAESPERAGALSLSDAQAQEIARLALACEPAVGGPADVEWALAEGRVWLVQARPITVAARPAGSAGGFRPDRQVWSNLNAGEVLPDVASPMTWSYMEQLVQRLFRLMLARCGVDVAQFPLVGRVAGRIYFNLNTILGAFRSLPFLRKVDLSVVFGGAQGSLVSAEALQVAEEDLPPVRFHLGHALLGLPAFVRWLSRRRQAPGFAHVRRMLARVAQSERIDSAACSEDQLVELLRAEMQIDEEFASAIDYVIAGMLWYTPFFDLCRHWLGDRHRALANRLLTGLGGMSSAEAGLGVWRLAGEARREPALVDALRSDVPWSELRERLRGVPGGTKLLESWAKFAQEHGHHCRGELELRNPRWGEQPEQVRAMVRACLETRAADDPLRNRRRAAEERRTLTIACRDRLANPLQRLLFDLVLPRAQRGLLLRENAKSALVRRIALARRWLLHLGEKLVQRRVLVRADDVFFLYEGEVDPVRRGAATFDVTATIARRRAELERDERVQPPPVVIGVHELDGGASAGAAPASAPGARSWPGVAVSSGVAIGRARVILRSDAGEALLPGEILIAPFTDPGWTPYFLTAAGIVMDMGGLMSHGAIVAREYGLPCVVNVGPATRGILTGQRVRVDGDHGIVQVLDEEEDEDGAD